MTVSTTISRADFPCNGATTVFPFTFPVAQLADLTAFVTDSAGNKTPLLNGSNCTITLNGTSGGSLTTTSTYATGYTVTIKRLVAITQPTSIRNQGAFFPGIHEAVFDRLIEIDQQQQEQLDRAAILPDGMSGSIGTPVEGTVLGWLNGVWTWVAAASAGLQQLLAATGPGQGAEMVGYKAPFTGAIGRLLNLKLSEQLSLADFGAVGDGVTTDTTAVQNAINAASATGCRLIAEKGKTYLCATLTPKSNVELDLQGSTIKLKSATNWLLFDGTGAAGAGFSIKNGTLDMNKAGNNANVNQCGGGAWFIGWSNLRFQDVVFQNAFRTSMVLNGCYDIVLDGVSHLNCGQANAYSMFGYGLEAYNSTARLRVNNFKVDTMYGFGIHLYGAIDCDLSNLEFNNLTQGGTAIAITGTQAYRCHIRNVKSDTVDGVALEINSCVDFHVVNTYAKACGDSALVVGDNGLNAALLPPTIFNQRVTIDGFLCEGTTGTYGAKLNYVQACTFKNMILDKPFTTDGSGGSGAGSAAAHVLLDRGNVIQDCTINSVVGNPANYYGKFILERVSFTNFFVEKFCGNTARFSNPEAAGTFGLTMLNGGVAYIDLNAWNGFGAYGFDSGRVMVSSSLNSQNSTYQEALFTVNNAGTAANISAPVVVNNASAKQVTLTGDAANKRLVLTNSTGNTITVFWTVETLGR